MSYFSQEEFQITNLSNSWHKIHGSNYHGFIQFRNILSWVTFNTSSR